MTKTIQLAMELISRHSITPEDAGCQALLRAQLEPLGCVARPLNFGAVKNLWITHGQGEPVLAFVGHTDVVPTGGLENWHSDPFTPEIRDGKIYGRGAADMKSSIAAFVTALERFLANNSKHHGTIALLITSDEEGPSIDGTVKVVEQLKNENIHIKWGLVGEPSSAKKLGDTIKNGRRGSLGGKLTIHGKQGHVAYPHLAKNPIHLCLPALNELVQKTWDQGNEFFPPTSFQISNINAGTGADNVIPEKIDIIFNYRFCTETTTQALIEGTESILKKHALDYTLDWHHSGLPFLTSGGDLMTAVKQAIKKITGYDTKASTAGGTSDGRFLAPTGTEVIEIGPLNETIHQLNECVSVQDIDLLSDIYQSILEQLYA